MAHVTASRGTCRARSGSITTVEVCGAEPGYPDDAPRATRVGCGVSGADSGTGLALADPREEIMFAVRFVAARIAAFAAASVAGLALATSVATPAPAASSDVGLFGTADPTYDGVYRQGLAILGLVAAGHQPDAAAIDWLLRQQCADGAFTAYRSDPTVPCTASKEDENATALAAMALAAVGGHGTEAQRAADAIKKFQLTDGGFYETAAFGTPASDANSTGLALSAFAAVGISPTSVASGGKTGIDFLRSIQLPCNASSGAGAFDYQPEPTLAANDYATVQATLGLLGKALPVAPGAVAPTTPNCVTVTDAATSAQDALAYLASRLSATGGAIPSAFGSGTDWTTTANAVLDLVAGGVGAAAVNQGLTALQANARTYVNASGAPSPGALGTLLLVAHATGADPTSFGGLDLISALLATERTAAPSSTPQPSPSPSVAARPSASAPASPAPTLPMTGSRADLPLGIAGGVLLLVGLLALGYAHRAAHPTR
ncbi:MAG: hypothetical protein K6T28_03625 [Acidothermus sp.]|nr:hypothetical protein [Acidothermus sp.]